ncbi:hypothetical protein KAU19_04480 [Candidatus Parcubacteria bacterium]|nr:hypothetical protein [Candidatus Parcubacteria bacterium]
MNNKKIKFKSLILLITLSVLTTGCISLTTSKQKQVVVDGGVFKTVNKGETWQHTVLIPSISGRPGSIANFSVNSMKMDPSDNKAIYYGSAGNGLFYTYDQAQTWQPAISLGAGIIKDVAIDTDSRCVIYAAIANAVYKSTDCNRDWSRVYYDNDLKVAINAIAIDHYNSEHIYIGSSRGEIIKSYDMGVSWQTLHRFTNNVERIIMDPHDSRNMFVATSKKGVYRSNNNGVSWVDLGDNLKEFKGSQNFRDLVISKAEPGLLFLATNYGLIRSEDSGDSWTEIKLIPPQQKATINAIAVNPQNASELYYVTNTTFYRSLDGGENWSTIKLPTARAGWKLLIDPENPSVIYMGVRSLR